MGLPELDSVLSRYAGRGRDALLPVLWDVQAVLGHVPPEAVRLISQALRVPEADIFGVIGFYSLLDTTPSGERVIRVCTDPACGLAGADALVGHVCRHLGIRPGETTADGRYTVEHAPCLGLCDHAPAALISQRGQGDVALGNVRGVDDLLSDQLEERPAYRSATVVDGLVLLKEQGGAQPETLAAYGGEYGALRAALAADGPQVLIDTVRDAGLIGRGGAAFPTAIKWQGARAAAGAATAADAAREPLLVCNADESEPGTFKDRVLMEQRPHLLLEGMALAAYAIGARQGYLFIRGEYPHAQQVMAQAITEAEAAGMLGANIMGGAFSFHVEIRRGAGAYICGEETALFEAIEGRRGFPRIKPPYPTTHGLFGRPTVINNVETLCAVPGIIQHGADWFRQWGTERSTGTKLVSVSGHVNRPGVFEIVPGMTLRALLETHCGGVQGELQAILMGGAAGTFLGPDDLELPLTFEDLRAAGSTFGSGAIMVFNTSTDLLDVLRRLGRFFQHESCGKCFPCQLGTQRQVEILERESPLSGDRERLLDIGRTMTEASLCGLGQTAGSAVMSALHRWPGLLQAAGIQEESHD